MSIYCTKTDSAIIEDGMDFMLLSIFVPGNESPHFPAGPDFEMNACISCFPKRTEWHQIA